MTENNKKIIFKRGGFPPIKYCPPEVEKKSDKSKERFFANTVKQNINIRQLLSNSVSKKPLIITESNTNDIDDIDVATEL
jgi:hypothetical protein